MLRYNKKIGQNRKIQNIGWSNQRKMPLSCFEKYSLANLETKLPIARPVKQKGNTQAHSKKETPLATLRPKTKIFQ